MLPRSLISWATCLSCVPSAVLGNVVARLALPALASRLLSVMAFWRTLLTAPTIVKPPSMASTSSRALCRAAVALATYELMPLPRMSRPGTKLAEGTTLPVV